MEKGPGQGFHPQPFRPQKSLGQHFLRSRKVLDETLAAADLKKSDLVVEVGPGQGVLTRAMAEKDVRVIAVEKDRRLIPLLQEDFRKFPGVRIVEGDILRDPPLGLGRKSYKLVANLPYYAATHIIQRFLEAKNPPRLIVVLLQKEVAQRICSRPPRMSLLSVAVQFYAQAKIVCPVPKRDFWPRPKVDSAVVRLEVKRNHRPVDAKLFFKIGRAGFSQPRKQLANNLSKGLKLSKEKTKGWLAENRIGQKQRAQDLEIGDWLALTKTFMLQ